MKTLRALLLLTCSLPMVMPAPAVTNVARLWNERALGAIRTDTPHPPAQARNLFSLSVCMWDAWAAYDTNGAVGYVYRGKHTAADVAAARREAISYAAWRILKERHFYSKTFASTLTQDDDLLTSLGYSTNNASRDTSTPAGVGNSVFDAVSAWFLNDGARQTNGTQAGPYPDYPTNQGGYIYINPPLATDRPGITDGSNHTVVDVNRWQRLLVVNAVDQFGFPQGPIQNYLGAQWLGVRPFSLARIDPAKPWIDPGPPPFLNGVGDAAFRSNVVEVIRRSSELTPDDGATLDISPGAWGNNTLGANNGTGRSTNPVTGLPYAPNVVRRGDFARVLAEFWADGPSSETPPGHWNALANYVSDYPGFEKRVGGTNAIADDLEWDVKLYFALNAGVHDAACAAWSLKRYYDGWRPMTAIRYLGSNGLPLITNLIELVTSDTVASGRHAGLTPGKIAIFSWPGQPSNPSNNYSGVHWIHADAWTPFQRTNFVTPPFPGYISGHSTFSRSAAEVLTSITGSPFFPGGLGTFTAASNTFLSFERGPSQTVQLQWGTYYDAADQAGISRLWGGIHPPVDDFAGRITGSQVGKGVWALAQKYFDGSVTNTPITFTLSALTAAACELRYDTLRGFFYKLQSTPDSEPALYQRTAGAGSSNQFVDRDHQQSRPTREILPRRQRLRPVSVHADACAVGECEVCCDSDMSSSASVIANGQPTPAPLPCSIEAFLVAQGLFPRSVAVEHNGEAVAPSEFAQRQLAAGDRLEIVKIVAGG